MDIWTLVIGALVVAIITQAIEMSQPPYRPGCGECEAHARRARQARAEMRTEQESLNHDAEHKGFGFKDGDPDRLRCMNDACPRNVRK